MSTYPHRPPTGCIGADYQVKSLNSFSWQTSAQQSYGYPVPCPA
ncbi:BQ5605_C031g10995 [Microbotryum silenes-dioicae]|uniref:BQ5605_C031g10995 protein n=1 Tax=Microbotryum silenes-dioicae TaxID=796604 RepID=A0A2X0MHY2_9BASI|nr:BQ5605_C031g10995 [Microbotryum silenes-dioicae]